MDVRITTRYRTRPGSNVGRYEARTLGRQISVIDQSIADPHREAADRLARIVVGPDAQAMFVSSNDAGTVRRWVVR